MDHCESCKLQFRVGDLVNEVRVVKRLHENGGLATDRMYATVNGYQHADQRVCIQRLMEEDANARVRAP